jgi:alpha-glucosidase
MPAGWDSLAVDAQAGSPGSMLFFYQQVLALRRILVGMLPNRIRWCRAPEGVLVYERGRLTVAINFLARAVDLSLNGRLLIGSQPLARYRKGRLTLPANSGAWLENSRLPGGFL